MASLALGIAARPLNREILGLIAEPVAITGEVTRQGDLFALMAEPKAIERIGSAGR